MKKTVAIISPYTTTSGYGVHSRLLIRSLLPYRDRFDIKLISMPWGSTPMSALDPNDPNDKELIDLNYPDNVIREQPDISIQVTIPSECQRIGKLSILVTAGTEADVAPPKFVEGANNADLIIVPSKFTGVVLKNTILEQVDNNTKQVVGRLQVTKPIEVLFEGVDTDVYSKTTVQKSDLSIKINAIPEKFCFLQVGHWLQGNLYADRKDISGLVHTFLRTFMKKTGKNRPALILKTSGAGYSIMERDQIIDKIWQIKELIREQDKFTGKFPSIYVLNGEMTDEQMNELYNHPKVKAFVTFSHAEGYGLPLAEFATTGKPIVAPAYSGYLDFLSPDHHALLPAKIVKVDPSAANEWIPKDSQWGAVNYTFAGQVLQNVIDHYPKYLEKSRKSCKHMKDNFSLTKMSDKFLELLEKYDNIAENVPQQRTLKLPKLVKMT